MNDAVVRLREDGVWGCEVEGCGWAKTVCRTQAFKHAKTKHPGCRPHALSKKAKPYRPRGQSEEEKKEAKRCYSRAYRAARKAQGAQEAQVVPIVRAPPPAPPDRAKVYALGTSGPPRAITVAPVTPGTGQRTLLGGAGPLMQDSMQVAVSWVQRQLFAVGLWLCPDVPSESLPRATVGPDIDVIIALPDFSSQKNGPSAGAAIALALVHNALYAQGLRLRPGVGVTGEINLRGQLLPVDGLVEKLCSCYEAGGFSVVVAPSKQAARTIEEARAGTGAFKRMPQELRDFVVGVLRPADTLIDAIRHAFQGVDGAPPFQELDGQQQGDEEEGAWLGACPSYYRVSKPETMVWVECCSLPHGTGQLIVTGCVDDTAARESVEAARTWLRLCWDSKTAPQLGCKRPLDDVLNEERDLHIHLGPTALLKQSSLGAAAAVAMASMASGRPVRPGLAMVGEMTMLGTLSNVEEGCFTRDDVRCAVEMCGLREIGGGAAGMAGATSPGLDLRGLRLVGMDRPLHECIADVLVAP